MIKLPRIGGSSAERIINCRGSLALCARASDQTDSEDSREGTLAHKLGELCLREGLDPEEMVDRSIDGELIPLEMAEAVTVFTDFVRSQFTGDDGQVDLVCKSTLRLEYEVDLTEFHPACKGTTDAFTYDPDARALEVTDYKHGAGVAVEVQDNAQLKYYGLGALLAVNQPVDRVILTVVQPNCDHECGPIRTTSTTPLALIEFGLELAAAIEDARRPDAPLKPGSWCQFCKAAPTCPALFEVAEDAASFAEFDHDMTDGSLPEDEVGRRLSMLPVLAFWQTAIRRYAWAEAQRGRIPTGFKIVRTRGKRRWVDPDLAMRQAVRAFTVDENRLFNKRAITPKAFEKLVGVKAATEFIGSYATKNSAAILVPASDRRDAIDPSANADFADVIQEMSHDADE